MTVVPDVRAARPRTRGIRQFVLKIHERCNLACDYCYVYEAADQSWRHKPAAMGPDVVAQTAERISEHVAEHRPEWIEVVLHGGEPLLAGTDAITEAVHTIRAAVGDTTRVRFQIQTNGVMLTASALQCLDALDVGVAVSLDGAAADHDRHRRFAHGAGSFSATVAGLELLNSPRFRHLFIGLLCVVDLDSDPMRTYEALTAFRPPVVDFLLPHRTWADPPPPGALYGSWLTKIFDAWWATVPRTTGVRIFDEIVAVSLGAHTATTAIGAGPVEYTTVETDGSIEADDILKVAYAGAPATGLNIWENDFDAYLASESLRGRVDGIEALCDQCRACEIVDVCGGGAYPHRYRPGAGFANPSSYCDDLKMLIQHICGIIGRDLDNPR